MQLPVGAGMIYLRDNPLLREPLKPEHIKNRLLGHWGSDPGQSFIWVHLNRLIRKYDLDVIFISGPGPRRARDARQRLSGRHVLRDLSRTRARMKPGCCDSSGQFSFPGGIGSHCTPETPGSIHEGGELGYSLSHAFGAAFDNPDLIVAVRGRRWRGGNRTAGHVVAFQQVPESDPRRRGAADPASEWLQDRQSHDCWRGYRTEELESLFRGYGWTPHFVEGDDPAADAPADGRDAGACVRQIRAIQQEARAHRTLRTPRWPMIVLRSPKGWTGPKEVDGHKVEGFWRAHQVPVLDVARPIPRI